MKSIYLVSYELRNPESIKNQEEIEGAIKSSGEAWWHHLPSVWLVAGDSISAQSLNSRISPKLKLSGSSPEDSLLIVKLSAEDRQGFLPKTAWEWFKKMRSEQTA